MIIECEKCESKFNLDESLLNLGGSKVRCSICKHVFTAYPPEGVPVEEEDTDQFLEEVTEETLPLDSGPVFGEEEAELEEETAEFSFEEAMEEVEVQEAVPSDELPVREEEIGTGETASMISEGLEEDLEAAVAAPSREKPRVSRLIPLILVIILLIVGGATAVFLFAPERIPDSLSFLKPSKKQEISDPGVARLSFKAVTGSFIQSNEAGQLFVIKGMVANNYPKPRSFIRIKGTILDDKGQPVRMKTAFAGNTFTKKEIKEKPLQEMEEGSKNRAGKGRMNFNILPGGAVPFMIIFENLPENISEFTVEAVRSSPGI